MSELKEKHLYKMGLIGNCSFMVHIDTRSSVKWLCWPRFDSSFVFGSLLDDEKGGTYEVVPEGDYITKQYYIDNTNVLVTDFESPEASFRITDFAPRFEQHGRYYMPNMFIRKIEPLHGTPRIKAICQPRGNYGQIIPEENVGSSHIRYLGLEGQLRLSLNIPPNHVSEGKYFTLQETKYMVLTWGVPLEASLEYTAEDFLRKTIAYWQLWVKSTSIVNFNQGRIIRSALTLKIHQYEHTGAIIASGTTGLPEAPGSGRNWDYRYCWMRDTYYTLTAFNNIGHFEELENYFNYIINIAHEAEHARLQPLYSIEGNGLLIEKELDLKGYQGNNRPVRIGNQAYEHIQNDVYGQVLVSLLPLYTDRRFNGKERKSSLRIVKSLLSKIASTMYEPDAGLWEFRNKAQKHCYTFLFHWAGAGAAAKIALNFEGEEEMYEKAIQLKAEAASIIEQCYDAERGVYTQAVGTPHLDASNLQLITMNYIDPSSEKARRHLEVMENELKTPEGLFYRYKHADDFGTPETTFLICSYWYVEALAAVGRVAEAALLFEKLAGYSNHLGLLSEDVDAETGSQWGNFPQTYSHVGQVNAAYRIAKKLDLPNFI